MRKNPTKIIKQKNKINLLAFRFSSMGDVALTLPVLKGLLEHNENLSVTLVTRPLYAPFFEGIPRLDLFYADFTGRHSGLIGLFRLFRALRSKKRYDAVIDLHGVLRTRILGLLFFLSGIPVRSINKGRKEKRRLIQGKLFRQLQKTVDRYLDVFSGIDLNFSHPEKPVLKIKDESRKEAEDFIRNRNLEGNEFIGIAPFALHELKTWPLSKTEQLIRMFEERGNMTIFLFGGTDSEITKLNDLAEGHPNRICLAGNFSLDAQLAFISKMKFMITMDSANMHLSNLVGTKTLTIWGATHPFAGFSGYLQPEENNIQISKDTLVCRPCTVFGSGTCGRGDFACMHWLTPETVYNKIAALGLF